MFPAVRVSITSLGLFLSGMDRLRALFSGRFWLGFPFNHEAFSYADGAFVCPVLCASKIVGRLFSYEHQSIMSRGSGLPPILWAVSSVDAPFVSPG